MSKNKQSISSNSSISIGSRIIEALTEDEISQLLNVLLAVLSDEQRSTALTQLQADTQETLNQIIAPPQTIEQGKTIKTQPTSLKKLAQTWSELWQEWNQIIWEASQEEGKYIAQEAHWEEPYFDNCNFVEDLEKVALKMKPLVQTAFEKGFNPKEGFASSLLEAESEISDGIPDWMEIHDGIHLESAITNCLLHWEWLLVHQEGQDGFKFAQKIREWEEEFSHISLDSHAITNFFLELPDAQQQCILAGMNANRESSMWKNELDNTYSPWHQFYMSAIHKYAPPEIYLDNLRATIGQQWQNGLPVIEDLLAKQEYQESLTVIQETLDALLKNKQAYKSWTPKTSLLFVVVNAFSYNDDRSNEKTLLRYYQQTVRELGETELVNALEIQHIAFESSFDWSKMFQTFAQIPVEENTRQALFESWRDFVIRRAKPHTSLSLYTRMKNVEIWWLHWLLDSIASPEKGCSWFQQKIVQWLTNLPGDKTQMGEDYGFLQLLTKDLTEIYHQGKSPYPKFDQVVIRPSQLSAPDDASRRAYLHKYAPQDLWSRVMGYWKANLHNFVPRPEMSQNSDYTQNAEWMAALSELAPQEYKNLLSKWKVEHQRRRNLWKAMASLGLS